MHQLHERADLFSPELQHSLLSPSSPTVTPPMPPSRGTGSLRSSNLALYCPDLPYPAPPGQLRAPQNPILPSLKSRDNRPRASRRHKHKYAGVPAAAEAASGSRGPASGYNHAPKRRDGQSATSDYAVSALPTEPLATAERLPARRPTCPSSRRSFDSSLVQPPGRGLLSRPSLAA